MTDDPSDSPNPDPSDETMHDDAMDDDRRRGETLRGLLGADAAADDLPPPGGEVDELRVRAGQRRQRKAAGLALVVVLVLVLGGTAFAVGHRSGGQVDVASNVPAGPDPRFTSTIPSYATPPPGFCPTVAAADGSTVIACAGPPSTGIVPADPFGPGSTVTTPVPPTTDGPSTSATAPPTTPETTIPPASTSSHASPTTTLGPDCGSSTPSGWPTTTMASPMLSACLLDGFDAGTPATLRVVVYRNDPDHPVTTTYLVVGVHQVRVTVDARRSELPPQTLTVQVCTTMAAAPGTAEVVTVGGCSAA